MHATRSSDREKKSSFERKNTTQLKPADQVDLMNTSIKKKKFFVHFYIFYVQLFPRINRAGKLRVELVGVRVSLI